MVQSNYLVLHDDDGCVLGVLIYDRKQFNYQQHIQHLIMDMFDLTIDQVNWYMKRWVNYTLNEDVLETDGVFGHEQYLFTWTTLNMMLRYYVGS